MLSMSRLALVVLLLALAFVRGVAYAQAELDAKPAMDAALSWLAMLDAGR